MLREVLAHVLNVNPRFKIIEAADGLEGLHACKQWAPDLVITGQVMPRMHGLDMVRAIADGKEG
jgi:YesN/AraC family two-component response regulator